jgi:hypothetical protein
MKKQERETKKEPKTSTSSRSLLGRGDLRGILGHLRGARACLSYRLDFLSILWWKKGSWRGIGIRKNDCKGEMGEDAGHYQEGHWSWAASQHVLFISDYFIEGSHVYIVLVFLSIPTFQAFYYICVCVCDKGHY